MKKIIYGLFSFFTILLSALFVNIDSASAIDMKLDDDLALYRYQITYESGTSRVYAATLNMYKDGKVSGFDTLKLRYHHIYTSTENVNYPTCTYNYKVKDATIDSVECVENSYNNTGTTGTANHNFVNIMFDFEGYSASSLKDVFNVISNIDFSDSYSKLMYKYSQDYPEIYPYISYHSTDVIQFTIKSNKPTIDGGLYYLQFNKSLAVSIGIAAGPISSAYYELIYDSSTEDEIYQNGYNDGVDSVDKTTDNQQAIEDFISDNNYHSNEEYLEYGEQKHQEGYDKGKIDGIGSVDITTDNQDAIDNYINENKLYTNEEFLEYGEEKHQEGYDKGKIDGIGSVDITSDNDTAYQNGYNTGYGIGYDNGQASIDIESIRQESYNNGFNSGQASVDITSDNEAIWNEAYQEGRDDGYTLGFEDGKDSIDLEEIKKAEYDRGYNNGYNIGFAEGESSVDITSDNDTVIDAYITINKYHTDYEFNLNYDKGYNAGINFIYNNVENDEVVNKYVKDYIYLNKYHTNTEYINSYELGYKDGYSDGYNYGYDKGIVDGKEVVYKNIESDPIIKEVWKEKLVNGTTINITNEGNEVVQVVKKYDVTTNSDDDLVINIHKGQDNYHVETVEEVIPGKTTIKQNTDNDYEIVYKVLMVVAAGLIGSIVIVVIVAFISSLFRPTKKIKPRNRKAGNGYVWSN